MYFLVMSKKKHEFAELCYALLERSMSLMPLFVHFRKEINRLKG